MGDVHNFRFRKMQDGFHSLRLFILHIENDLGLAVVDDAFAVFSVIQSKEVVQILRGKDAGSGVSPDDLPLQAGCWMHR